ncbi:hypothetical protein ACFLZV_05750 [Candidatus Margulisiibacteriota bacterium]
MYKCSKKIIAVRKEKNYKALDVWDLRPQVYIEPIQFNDIPGVLSSSSLLVQAIKETHTLPIMWEPTLPFILLENKVKTITSPYIIKIREYVGVNDIRLVSGFYDFLLNTDKNLEYLEKEISNNSKFSKMSCFEYVLFIALKSKKLALEAFRMMLKSTIKKAKDQTNTVASDKLIKNPNIISTLCFEKLDIIWTFVANQKTVTEHMKVPHGKIIVFCEEEDKDTFFHMGISVGESVAHLWHFPLRKNGANHLRVSYDTISDLKMLCEIDSGQKITVKMGDLDIPKLTLGYQ